MREQPPAGQRRRWVWARQFLTKLRWARLLMGAFVGGALLSALHVPAGALLGSVVGAALVNYASTTRTSVPRFVRIVGYILLGTITGAALDARTLGVMATIVLPVLAAVALLLVLNMLLAMLLVRRYGVDPMTAVLATAPGGLSEILGISIDWAADTSLVVAVHTMRVLTIVLVALPLLVVYLSAA